MHHSRLAIALLLACSATALAQNARPTVTIPNVSLDQVKNGLTAWCLTNAMDIAEAESNRVVCTKPIKGGRGAFISMLNGGTTPPQIRLEASFASTGTAVIVTAKQQLETQRNDGVVERTDFTQKEVIAGTQSILDEVAAGLTPAAPAPATTPETPASAPEKPQS